MKRLVFIALLATSLGALAQNPFDPYGNNARMERQMQEQQELFQQRQIANEQQWKNNFNAQRQSYQPIPLMGNQNNNAQRMQQMQMLYGQ